MAAFESVFVDRGGVVAAEIVAVEARADEAAALVKGYLPQSRVARADLQTPEAAAAGRRYGMAQECRADALSLAGGFYGDVHHLGREGARMQQQVLADDPPVAHEGITIAARKIVRHRGFVFVGQQQQFVRRGIDRSDFEIHGGVFQNRETIPWKESSTTT